MKKDTYLSYMIDWELYFLFSHSRSIKAKEHLHILGFNIKNKKGQPVSFGPSFR